MIRQTRLDEYHRRLSIHVHLPSWKLLILLFVLMFSYMVAAAPIQAEPDQGECPPFFLKTDAWYSTKVADLAHYLWVYHRAEIVQTSPFTSFASEMSQEQTPADFMSTLTNNTQLAIDMSKQFGYGYGLNGASGIAQPYGQFWQANYWAELFHQMMFQGNTVHQIWNCGRNHYGFDEDFVAAALSMAHTYMGNGEGWSYSMNVDCNDLDPAVYGNHPMCISVPEPGYVLLPDGHVAFGNGGCPYYAMEQLDGNGSPMPRYSHAGCFGAHSILLIVPEAVVNQVTPGVLGGAASYFQSIWGGNGDPLMLHLAAEIDPTLNLRTLSSNWVHMQTGYSTLIDALKNYHVEGVDWNFSRLTRVPLDTRFPESIRKRIVWESFPSPVEQLAPAFADPSVTLEGFHSCLGSNLTACVKFSGYDMASSYAFIVAQYLAKYGLFTWCQDSFIRPWLKNYVQGVDQLPNFDITTDGHYNYFQTSDAYSRYNPDAAPTIQPLSVSQNLTEAVSEDTQVVGFSEKITPAPTVITATALGGLPSSVQRTPPDISIVKPAVIVPNDTVPVTPTVTYAPVLGSGIGSFFLGIFLFVAKVHRKQFDGEELPESRELFSIPTGVEA